ncbi:hypothetical protein [Streptosporangium canum]|uniref:hypothetical protein n=1 Tax=Streptosporangium canum TaxID=324952 RepID=UPI0037A7B144
MATTLRSLLLTATGSVAVLGAVLAMRATAATGEFVLARGVELEIHGIPALGQEAFTGSWGRASMGPSGGEDGGDWADPDGVRAFVSLAGRRLRARVAAPVSWEAGGRFRVRQLRLNPRAGLPLLVTGTVRTGVSWRPSGPAGSSVVAAPGSVAVLGQPVEAGTTSVPATGVQLGYPGVTGAVLTVVRTDVRKTSPHTGGGARTAEAGMILAISGRMFDASGAVVYDGPLAEVTLGGASVDCAGGVARQEPGLIRPPVPAPTPSGTPASAPPATGDGPDGMSTFAESLLGMPAVPVGCSRPSA